MTKIKFYEKNSFIVKMELDGHTGLAQSGEDVLCAGISAISQSAVLGLKQVVKCHLQFERREKQGYLCCKILESEKRVLEKTQIIMETALIALQDLQIGNEKFMKVEVCDEIY